MTPELVERVARAIFEENLRQQRAHYEGDFSAVYRFTWELAHEEIRSSYRLLATAALEASGIVQAREALEAEYERARLGPSTPGLAICGAINRIRAALDRKG